MNEQQDDQVKIIKKIEEFAEEGDRSLSGMSIPAGFPKQQKPYRQWMNYLFNWLSTKTNEVVDGVNANALGVAVNQLAISNLTQRVEPLFKPIKVGELLVTTKDYPSGFDVAEDKGYGTWERYAEGRTLVGFSEQSGDPSDYKKMGNKFGANTHRLTVDEMPSHKHAVNARHESNTAPHIDDEGVFAVDGIGGVVKKHASSEADGSEMKANGSGNAMFSEGGNQPHNNVQPSAVVAYWLRVE